MLLAPKPPATHSPKANPQADKEERYSLTQLLNLLQLADRLMDCGKPRLHKLGYHEPAVLYFLKEMDVYLKFHSSQFDDILKRTQDVIKEIETTESLHCEMAHTWARLLKYMFMNANVLNLNDMRVNCSRSVYVADLKALLANTSFIEAFNSETNKIECQVTNLDRAVAQGSLYEFMGQLLALGFESSVKAIHNYLYLAKKVVNAKERSGMSAEHIAVTIAPTIHEMLLLDNLLFPVRPDAKNHIVEMKKSLQFITAIFSCLLQTTRFDTQFDPAVYKDYKQTKYAALYQGLMPVLTDPNRLQALEALTREDPTLESQFKKLHIKHPSAIQAGYTCDALVASLSKKEDEPIVRTTGRMLTKSAASRTLNKQISAEDLEEYHRSMQPPAEDILAPAAILIFSVQGADSAEVPIAAASNGEPATEKDIKTRVSN